ncbi:uncharacterized protein K452DRAFT_11673 [Aplosporella prunicola CBS 121167]|uniref:Uncharacterized protein n=1 Tax=Aplosporella prunicola CBS 121167 TaxID=1176127 RepID=A0A6A6BHW7_9PEZI|nr:uncharacterized protein K452DRAFT_11673 [Aplosporella prunicola CBS 121167]KAF2142844.1 hypothetical protein K452DRAFT_11673 [Aplosporella prunicola CBS 121167]
MNSSSTWSHSARNRYRNRRTTATMPRISPSSSSYSISSDDSSSATTTTATTTSHGHGHSNTSTRTHNSSVSHSSSNSNNHNNYANITPPCLALPPISTALPQPPRQTYHRSGIGGLGNYHKPRPFFSCSDLQQHQQPLLRASQPPSTASPTGGVFASGIGGAGNLHRAESRARLAFAEEVARGRAVARSNPATYHCGIGGAGNRVGAGLRLRRGGRRQLQLLREEQELEARRARCYPVSFGAGARSEGDLCGGFIAERAPVLAYEALPSCCFCGGSGVRACICADAGAAAATAAVGPEASYSHEPLPYGALDMLKRRLGRAFGLKRSAGASAQQDGEDGTGRRVLRRRRSMWHF